MKQLNIKDVINSEAYKVHAEKWSQSAITVCVITMIFCGVFKDLGLGFHWLWIVPITLVLVNFFVAMPTMLVNVALATWYSANAIPDENFRPIPKGKLGTAIKTVKNSWGIVARIIEVLVTLYFVVFLSSILN